MLAASEVEPIDRLSNVIILGELTLEGKIKGILGILPALMAAKKAGFNKAIVPVVNAQEAGLVSGLEILAMSTLKNVRFGFELAKLLRIHLLKIM